MARAPDERYLKAYKLYMCGRKLIEIANQLELPEGTVRRWKCTHKWDSERSEINSERSHKRGAPKGSKNAKGNKGGAAPMKNKNAETHGLNTKWLPEETVQIIGELAGKEPLDILYDNILLQLAAITRSQKIMHVEDKGEIIKEVIKTKVKSKVRETEKTTTTDNEEEIEYAFQFPWDRQATFMNAQSRAYATLINMFRQYDEMLHKNWDLATEEQKARIEALKKQAGNGPTGGTDNTGVIMMPPIIKDGGTNA